MRKNRLFLVGSVIAMLILLSCSSAEEKNKPTEKSLQSLSYNNPGLITDLGVGLWALPLPMDYDNDGDMDLVISCPDTPDNGLYFFENTSDGKKRYPVFMAPRKIGPGKKNIQVSFVNGQEKVLGPGVEYESFKKEVFGKPVDLYPEKKISEQFRKVRFNQWKYVDFDNDGDMDIIVGISEWKDYGWDNAYDEEGHWLNGPLHGYLFLLENDGGTYHNKGKIKADGKPIDVYGAPSPNMTDFDGDGDLDIICGEFLDRFTWFENIGSRDKPVFSRGRYLKNNGGVIKMDLEMIVPVAVDWDKDGDMDLVVGQEDGRVALIENTGQVTGHMPVFKDPVFFRQQSGLVKFGVLVTPFSVDWDQDGDEDLICGNSAGYIGFIENLDGGNPPKWNEPVYLKAGNKNIRIMAGDSGSIQGPAEKKWGYTTLSVADWDGDGLLDIIANSIWGRIVWYKNVGSPQKPVLAEARPVIVNYDGETPKPVWNWWNPVPGHLVTQWRTTPYATDWNHDGLTDLVMLDTEGYLCLYKRIKVDGRLQLLPGKRIFYGVNASVFDEKDRVKSRESGPLRLNGDKAGKSGRRKFCLTDWDGDGDMDLLVNSVNVSYFENVNEKEGKVFFKYHGPLFKKKLAGHSTSPTIVNWDGNTLPDLLIGAEDGHFYYYNNKNK